RDYFAASRSHPRRSCETQSGVIQIRRVWHWGRDDRLLIDQPAARIERVGNAALENPELQSFEQHFDSAADASRFRAYWPECRLEAPRPIGMIAGIIEELVEAGTPPTLSGDRPVLRSRIPDDRDRANPD